MAGIGPAEIRDVDPGERYFTPHSHPLDTELRRYSERPPDLEPAIDATEAFLLRYSFADTLRTAPGVEDSPHEWTGAAVL